MSVHEHVINEHSIPDNNALELDNWVECTAIVDFATPKGTVHLDFCGEPTYTGSAYCPAHLNREIW